MTLSLIDKQDSFEIIRSQIAAILATETANQQALATAASKDPELWRFRVYEERAAAWEQFLNLPNDGGDSAPIAAVWFDTSTFEEGASNIMERQACTGTFNVDVYGHGQSRAVGGGHDPGDYVASTNAQRTVRLVRNILMAAENTYLQLRGLVWQRWVQSITSFQPAIDNKPIFGLWAVRLAFRVKFNEFAPQVEGEPLELVSVQVCRAEDGEIYFGADYDYTL